MGDYGDFLMQLYDVVGQINTELKDTDLDKNTLLLFTSDNEPSPMAVNAMAPSGHAAAGVLRGKKSDAWEGGHRIPFIAKWPGRIPAGGIADATIDFTDFFATFAELLEAAPTEVYPGSTRDSCSFLPVLLAPSKTHPRPAMINGRHAIHKGEWKMIAYRRHEDAAAVEPSRFELYDLENDIPEHSNVSQTNPKRTKQLLDEFREFVEKREHK